MEATVFEIGMSGGDWPWCLHLLKKNCGLYNHHNIHEAWIPKRTNQKHPKEAGEPVLGTHFGEISGTGSSIIYSCWVQLSRSRRQDSQYIWIWSVVGVGMLWKGWIEHKTSFRGRLAMWGGAFLSSHIQRVSVLAKRGHVLLGEPNYWGWEIYQCILGNSALSWGGSGTWKVIGKEKFWSLPNSFHVSSSPKDQWVLWNNWSIPMFIILGIVISILTHWSVLFNIFRHWPVSDYMKMKNNSGILF